MRQIEKVSTERFTLFSPCKLQSTNMWTATEEWIFHFYGSSLATQEISVSNNTYYKQKQYATVHSFNKYYPFLREW